MNETILKFNYPNTLLHEYENWVVLLRPKQITLGCMILAHKGGAEKLGDVSPEAFAELAVATRQIETVISKVLKFDKINYLLLMMMDKHVHFHVIPRYSSSREFFGTKFTDDQWPKPPDLSKTVDIPEELFFSLRDLFSTNWP